MKNLRLIQLKNKLLKKMKKKTIKSKIKIQNLISLI